MLNIENIDHMLYNKTYFSKQCCAWVRIPREQSSDID